MGTGAGVLLVLAAALLGLLCAPAIAAEEAEEVYESTAAVREAVENVVNPEISGETAQEVISQFFPEVEEDEGTYPASEFLDQNFLLRRQGPAKGSYSGRVFTRYSRDEISDVEKWEKEFELNLAYKDIDAYFRFGDVNPFAYENDPMRWEKGRVRYKREGTEVTVGSFGALFGRGLALNMFEDRVLDFDNEADGIKVEQEIGEGQLTALWGTHKSRDELSASTVRAARYSMPVTDDLEVGVHAVDVIQPDHNSTLTEITMVEWELMGGDVTWRAKPFTFFGEVVGLKRPILETGAGFNRRGEDGLGYYVNVVYGRPGFALDVEFKDYRRLLHPFSVLPPIRRWNESATAAPNGDKGYGVGLNWAPSDNGSHFSAHYAQEQKYAPYSELLMAYSSPTGGSNHYVIERWEVNNLGEKHQYNRFTFDQKLNPSWTSTVLLEHERRNLGFKPPHNVWTFQPEVAFESKFNFVYLYEFSGEPRQTPESRKEWKLIELKYHPTEDQEINLVWGARQAGFVCSGGVCRPEPEFSGFKVDYLLRF